MSATTSPHADSPGADAQGDALDPLALVRWVPASENPFGVEVLDCSVFAGSMVARQTGRMSRRASQNCGNREANSAIGTEDERAWAATGIALTHLVYASSVGQALGAVDDLVKSHVYRLVAPHPLPRTDPTHTADLALWSYSCYGRRGICGTMEAVTHLDVRRNPDGRCTLARPAR